MGQFSGRRGRLLQGRHALGAFQPPLVRRQGKKYVAHRTLLRHLQARGPRRKDLGQLLVVHLNVFGHRGRLPAQDLEIERTDAVQGGRGFTGHDHGRRTDEFLDAGQAQAVADHAFELPLGESARGKLLLHESGVFDRVKLPPGLENRQHFDAVDHRLIARFDAEAGRFMLHDHEVPDEVVGRLIFRLRLPGEITDQFELAQGKRQLVVAHRTFDIHLHDIAPVDLGDDVAAHALEIGCVVKPREGDDGHRGNQSHEPALVLADSGEHGTIVLKKTLVWLNWSA